MGATSSIIIGTSYKLAPAGGSYKLAPAGGVRGVFRGRERLLFFFFSF